MAFNASYDDCFDVPGGDNFADVTDLFVAGSQGMRHENPRVAKGAIFKLWIDMEPEEVILMDGFTLMDAMSAFEVS